MGLDRVTVWCPWCSSPMDITTKPVVERRELNPTTCEACGSVVIIKDPNGQDLNLWWSAGADSFEREILEMFNANTFGTKVAADAFRKAVKEYGKDAIQAAAETLVTKLQGRPLGTWLVGDVIRMVQRHANYIGVKEGSAQAPMVHLGMKHQEEQ